MLFFYVNNFNNKNAINEKNVVILNVHFNFAIRSIHKLIKNDIVNFNNKQYKFKIILMLRIDHIDNKIIEHKL